jgi:microcystin-dependent protein
MSEPFLGQIALFGFNFPPRGWALCSGQTLSIASNTALFALLGTQYGGNGVSTFGLPNLNGRGFVGQGQGPGLTIRTIGEQTGAATHTLTAAEMPGHTHLMQVYSGATGTAAAPAGGWLLVDPLSNSFQPSNATPITQLAASTLASAGGSQAHNNMQPYLVLNYCIATQGIFPSRN